MKKKVGSEPRSLVSSKLEKTKLEPSKLKGVDATRGVGAIHTDGVDAAKKGPVPNSLDSDFALKQHIAPQATINATPETSVQLDKDLRATADLVEHPDAKAILNAAQDACAQAARLQTSAEPLRVALKADPNRPRTLEGRIQRKLKGKGDNQRVNTLFRPFNKDFQPIPIDAKLAEGLGAGGRMDLVLEKTQDGKQQYKAVPNSYDLVHNFVADIIVEDGQAFAVARGPLTPYDKVPLNAEDPESLVGQAALVRVHDPGEATRTASIKEPLGAIDSPRAHLTQIAADGGIDFGFSKKAIAEVDSVKQAGLTLDGTDYRHVPFVTIDNDDSKDLDQAMAIERKPDGGYRIYYGIADAAWFLDQCPALDKQAMRRAGTSYLPHTDYPLMPRDFSEDLCSLNEGVDRRAFVIVTDLDEHGGYESAKLDFGVINSRAKLSYRRAQEFHDQNKTGELAGHDYTPTLELLEELGEKAISLAEERGVVPSPDPSGVLLYKADGSVAVGSGERYRSEKWNEQISLVSNFAVGKFVDDHGVKGLHRVHPTPEPERFDAFRAQVETLGFPWPEGQPLNTYIKGLDPDLPVTQAIQRLAIRTNLPATYELESGGHYGLKLEHYAHATAPMRRYNDVMVHRLVRGLLDRDAGRQYKLPSNKDLARVIKRAGFAKFRDREIGQNCENFLKAYYFKDKLNEAMQGHVVEVNPSNMLVQLEDPKLQVRVPVSALNSAGGTAHTLAESGVEIAGGTGSYRLGDAIEVAVTESNPDDGRVVAVPTKILD